MASYQEPLSDQSQYGVVLVLRTLYRDYRNDIADHDGVHSESQQLRTEQVRIIYCIYRLYGGQSTTTTSYVLRTDNANQWSACIVTADSAD